MRNEGKRDGRERLHLWSDPKHWSVFGYRCADDPRVMVPKRDPRMGWTMNWASPWAAPAILALVVIALCPMLGVAALGSSLAVSSIFTVLAALLAIPLTVWLVVSFCRRLSR
jgi:hypothetical protein